MTGAGPAGRLALPGVLTAAQAADTVRGILAVQQPDGAIPWFPGHHLDPWDHTEAAMALDAAGEHEAAARAYRWLADHQNADGSWYAAYTDSGGRTDSGGPIGSDGRTDSGGRTDSVGDRGRETNFCAYPAVGVWHHYLATGDETFLAAMWPVVRAAVGFVLELQQPGGQIGWKRDADGTDRPEALLTGCSSIHHALRCALAAAARLGEPQPGWELAAGGLRHALRRHPERFLDKSRYSMDWYYPVLGGALTGAEAEARIAEGWDRFVVPGLGVRCVLPNPWVTGGESAELALALWSMGDDTRARAVLRSIAHLRDPLSGLYWTGYVFADRAVWPEELTTWTAGSLLLAVAALSGDTATRAVFGGAGLPPVLDTGCGDEHTECGGPRRDAA